MIALLQALRVPPLIALGSLDCLYLTIAAALVAVVLLLLLSVLSNHQFAFLEQEEMKQNNIRNLELGVF